LPRPTDSGNPRDWLWLAEDDLAGRVREIARPDADLVSQEGERPRSA